MESKNISKNITASRNNECDKMIRLRQAEKNLNL